MAGARHLSGHPATHGSRQRWQQRRQQRLQRRTSKRVKLAHTLPPPCSSLRRLKAGAGPLLPPLTALALLCCGSYTPEMNGTAGP